jgi:hypothetical protein
VSLGVALLVVLVAAAVGGLYLLGSRVLGQRLDFGNGQEVYYAEGATKEQADGLGRALQDEKYFDGSGANTVRVAKEGNGFVVSFVVQPGLWNQGQHQRYFLLLAGRLSGKIFHDAPVEVRMCDEYLRTKKTIAARHIEFGPGEWVYFPAEVPEAEVRVLGRVLQEAGVFDGNGRKDVFLETDAGRLVVCSVVQEGAWELPPVVEKYRAIRAKFSQALGGRDVQLRLLDPELTRGSTIP